jgi:hypothetical protein
MKHTRVLAKTSRQQSQTCILNTRRSRVCSVPKRSGSSSKDHQQPAQSIGSSLHVCIYARKRRNVAYCYVHWGLEADVMSGLNQWKACLACIHTHTHTRTNTLSPSPKCGHIHSDQCTHIHTLKNAFAAGRGGSTRPLNHWVCSSEIPGLLACCVANRYATFDTPTRLVRNRPDSRQHLCTFVRLKHDGALSSAETFVYFRTKWLHYKLDTNMHECEVACIT